ncbi:MAG: tryptophan synthase subunit alpha [Anaerolineae bacterium]|nr:tryptophan synthase subunit alpha [Anaerolineae bacterium]
MSGPQPEPPSGLAHLSAMFAQAEQAGRAAFLPYFPIGFPDYDASLAAISAMAEAGVDGFEIGMPFSDPLADGPTIQAATQVALQNGVTVQKCLDAVRELRARGLTQPMLMMGYTNPVLAYGTERFVQEAKAAGADGLIIPDLPPEESAELTAACARAGLAMICFLAPTSTTERIRMVAQQASGFIYVVSVTGITGARSDLPPDLQALIDRIRAETNTPLVLGFGIGTPEQARRMNGLVDGFIVGSALVRAGESGVEAVRGLSQSIRQALDA